MSATRGLVRASLLVSAAFFASRALGYVRVGVTTSIFGAGPELDAFFAAFRIPDLMFQLVAAGALGSALVPVVAGLLATGGSERAWRIGATVANLMLVALAVLAATFALLAPAIVPAITPGFEPTMTERTIELTRIMLLSPVLLALGAVAASLLNAAGSFVAAALAPVIYNVAIIGAAIILGPTMGVTSLAVGVVAGSAGHLLIQLPTLRRLAYRHRFAIDLRDATARQVLQLMAPRALGLGAVQVTFLVNTTLASALGAGAITAYTVAFTLLQLPLGLVAQPLGIVALPTMSRAAASGGQGELAALVRQALRLLTFTTLGIAVLAIVLRREAVTLLFGYGRFDEAAVDATAGALGIFLLGLPAHSAIAILARAFYAAQDTRTPMLGAVLAVGVNVAVSVATVGELGIRGLALGIAAGAWLEATFLVIRLAGAMAGLSAVREAAGWLRSAVLAAVAGAVTWTALTAFGWTGPLQESGKLAVALVAATATAAFGALYVGLAGAFRQSEPATIARLVVAAVRGRRGT